MFAAPNNTRAHESVFEALAGNAAGTTTLLPPPWEAAATTPDSSASAFPGARILVVDDEDSIRQLLDRVFASHGYTTIHARNGQEALELIAQKGADLVISDVLMPDMDGMELCRQLKSNPETALLPVLLLTSLSNTQDRTHAFESGADEFVSKPFQQRELIARTRGMLRVKFLQDQLENAEEVIFSLARAVEAKDAYTGEHIERVSRLAKEIGQFLGCDKSLCANLVRGGILHDIGKIAVPDSVLNKTGKLTDEEFELIKLHPVRGEEICRSLKTLRPILSMVRHHHERLDGSGYPDRLEGEAIHLPARIMAVCDVFDALTSNRAYRKAMDLTCAMAILHDGVSAGHWDGGVVAALEAFV